jgi:autotransporter-associated beta strand protein
MQMLNVSKILINPDLMKLHPTQTLNKLIGIFGFLLLITSVHAQFTFPVYEPFSEYPEGERLRTVGSSGVYWNVGNSLSSSSSPIISTNYALSYPGLLPDPNVPARGILGPQVAGRTQCATFTAQNSGTTYLSFLLSVSNLPSADRPIIGLNAANSSTPSPNSGPSIWITPSGQLKLDKSNSTTPQTNTTPALTIGSTYLVVMAYNFAGTGTNEVDLWLNPTVLGNNASVPTPTIFITNNVTSVASLQSLCLYSGTGIAVSLNLFDEIRVTNTWAGATPASPAPGNVYNVTGGGFGCPGDTFAVGLSGSDSSSVNYMLYINGTNSGQTVSGNNSVVTFGLQSITGTYNVLASNTVNSYVGWMSGSVSVSVLTGPSITTQPAPVLVATNGYATFSVAATGSGLHYQWYKGGSGLTDGGHVSGSATVALTISPATTADAAATANGYYVIITNSCSLTATSTTNSLTLQPAGNLVWQGGNPNTNWDFAITQNWTNSAGNSVVFNAGDKVMFDDSSTNQIVTLVGSVAPTSVTDNSSLNYFFTGSGSISGTASLLMNGSGMLTISNANSYTGGTTISSGILKINNSAQQPLGTGLVTLAGGQLEIGIASGSATAGLSNINVTANSTLQLDAAGTFAFVLQNQLTGSPGATLTIQELLNNSSGACRVRLYGAFTNNARMIISELGGNGIDMAPYLSSGDQVYNGIISGYGGRFVARGNGNAIFNAANTFNDSSVQANGAGPSGYSVLMSSGNVGVGADSSLDFSAVAPGTGSSPLGTGNLGINVGTEGGACSLFASGGAHTVANHVVYTSTTNTVTLILGGNNNLTLAGEFSLSGGQLTGANDTFGTNRTLQVTNTALTVLSGVIDDAGLGSGIIKTGTGVLALNGTDTYTGSTIVSNGMLEGIGSITSPVTVETNGTLGAGTASIGTFTINSDLTLLGNLFIKVNRSTSPSNDVIAVSGTLANTGTGTVTVTNLGSALAIGNTFKLFSKPISGGGALTVTGAGMNWTNNLAIDGSIAVLSVASTVATNPTNILSSVIGGTNLALSWPADHLGWRLQVQTNTLAKGLDTNWVDVAGATSVNSTNFTINPANGAVFYRLVYP